MRARSPAVVALLATGLLRLAPPAAADEAIVADRPGFGESASAVAARRLQLETGLTWTSLGDGEHLFDAPEALLRYGIGRSLEVRLVAPDWLRPDGPAGTVSGWSDTAIGVKWRFGAGGSDLSLRGTLYLDTGSLEWTAGVVEPEVALAWSRGLSERWSLGATVSVRELRALGTEVFSPSVSFQRSLGPRASVFVEYGASYSPDARPVHRIDHGYVWLPTKDVQVDVSIGVGLSAVAPDFFVGAGLSRRF